MKTIKIFLPVLALIFLVSCSDEDTVCKQSDWLGTYELKASTAECDDPDVEIDEEFTITAGSTSDKVRVDGIDYAFVDCKISDPNFGIDIQLDDDEISFEAFGCSGEFKRK